MMRLSFNKQIKIGLMIEDPLRHIYVKRLIVYLVLLTICLLWPFDLFQRNQVRWLQNSTGVEFVGTGLIMTETPAVGLLDKLKQGQGLSIEVWLATSDSSQFGPARIVSYSLNWALRNFTLGQDGKNLVIRLRTTYTDPNGTVPSLRVENVFNSTEPTHIIVTFEGEREKIFIDGQQRLKATIPGTIFSNWDQSFHLFFGNEGNANRPWLGKLFRVSLYNRPLEESEVLNKFNNGVRGKSSPARDLRNLPERGLVANYLFAEGKGNFVGDSADNGKAINLHIPKYARNYVYPYMRWPDEVLVQARKYNDTILNILGLIPFGFLMHGTLRDKFGISWRLSAMVLCIGFLSILVIESLQHFSISRDSSLLDLLNNMLGIVIGIIIDRSYIKHVQYYWMRQAQQ
jgi:hypothetical protein